MKKRPRDPAQLAKFIVDVATGEIEDRKPTPEEQGKDPAAAALGAKGGRARAKKVSATFMDGHKPPDRVLPSML